MTGDLEDMTVGEFCAMADERGVARSELLGGIDAGPIEEISWVGSQHATETDEVPNQR